MRPLTTRENTVIAMVTNSVSERGESPTIREMARELNVTHTAVARCVADLCKLGLLVNTLPWRKRGLRPRYRRVVDLDLAKTELQRMTCGGAGADAEHLIRGLEALSEIAPARELTQ